MIVAQITDPHVSLPGTILFGGYDPATALGAVLDRVARLDPRPDMVFFTGDLTENGTAEEYAYFISLLAGFDLPCAAIPGNHDRRDAFLTAFAGTKILTGDNPSWLHLVIEGPGLRLIGLDTLALEGEPGGALDSARLDWLARRLEDGGEQPTLVMMHHPPFATGIAAMDIWGLAEPEGFAALIARHPNVLRVCCGHVHRSVQTVFAGTIAGICPAVAWQVPLFQPGILAPLVAQSPGFQLHCWDEERGLVTHTEFLAGLPGTRA